MRYLLTTLLLAGLAHAQTNTFQGNTTATGYVAAAAGLQDTSTAARGTCNAAARGTFYVEKGTGASGADQNVICNQTNSTGPVFTWVATGSGGGGSVTSVSGTAPIVVATGTSTPAITLGNIPVANLNSGTAATAATFWRGDATWKNPLIGANTYDGMIELDPAGSAFATGWRSPATLAASTFYATPPVFPSGPSVMVFAAPGARGSNDPASATNLVSDSTLTLVSSLGGGTFATAGQGYTWALTGTTPPSYNSGTQAYWAASTTRADQMVLPSAYSFRKAVVYIGTALGSACAGGTCGLKLAIYDAACSTKLGETVAYTTAAGTGNISLTFASAPVVLAAGTYWIVAGTDSTVLGIGQSGEDPTFGTGMRNTNVARSGTTANAMTGNGASVTFPAACGSITTSSVRLPVYFLEP